MLRIRLQLVYFSYKSLSAALTIASRYSIVRRQFPISPGGIEERQLIDYQSH